MSAMAKWTIAPLLESLAILVLLVSAPPIQCRGAEMGTSPSVPASSSLDEVRRETAASRTRLRCLKVTIDLDGRPAGQGSSETLYSRHTAAALGSLRLTDNVHWSSHYPADLDLNHHKVYYTGESLDVYYPLLGYYETSRRNAHEIYSLKARSPLYFECLAWWPPDDLSDSPQVIGRPFYLHESLAQDAAHVRPRREQVDGQWCDVVDVSKTDVLWLDPAIHHALRRRECRSPKTGELEAVFALGDYREAAPGIWLPWEVRRILYDATRIGADGQPATISDAHARVADVAVNDLARDQFTFQPRPGLLVLDVDTAGPHQVPGGLTFLDETIHVARRLSAIDRPTDTGSRISSRFGHLLVGVTVALGALDLLQIAALCWRKWRNPSGPEGPSPRPASGPS